VQGEWGRSVKGSRGPARPHRDGVSRCHRASRRLPRLLPLPGAAHSAGKTGTGTADERVLTRIRALLAKAESTDYAEEAEALSAKAQELMTRHSLKRLVVEAAADDRAPASARRLWLDAPYAGAKALLVDVVAVANRCSAVWSEDLGVATVVGDQRDLALTELLVTSLLVQATRAMVDGGQQAATRQRSFRQSFLIAYATRIGERLRKASDTATTTEQVLRPELLPVLAAENERVERARDAMFPTLVSRRVAVSNAHGWAAGRAAADQARLDNSPEIDERAAS
jgi:hypothetical protein